MDSFAFTLRRTGVYVYNLIELRVLEHWQGYRHGCGVIDLLHVVDGGRYVGSSFIGTHRHLIEPLAVIGVDEVTQRRSRFVGECLDYRAAVAVVLKHFPSALSRRLGHVDDVVGLCVESVAAFG